MQIRRSRSVVDRFTFEKRDMLKKEAAEPALQTDVVLLNDEIRNQEKVTTVGVQLTFKLVLERFLVSGKVSQINYIVGKDITSEEDFSEEEIHELLTTLFQVIHRLTYEVTEIALDEPGTTIDFSPIEKRLGKEG